MEEKKLANNEIDWLLVVNDETHDDNREYSIGKSVFYFYGKKVI